MLAARAGDIVVRLAYLVTPSFQYPLGGTLILPRRRALRQLVASLTALKTATDRCTPGLTQLVLTRFIAEGRLAAQVRRMRTLYRERRVALLGALAAPAADVLDVGEPPDAGLSWPCG